MNELDKNILDMDEESQIRIEEIGESDILVGIPSYNNERTIAHVIKAVEYGLTKYFPEYKSVLVNSDGGSTDRTREIVEETSVYSDLDTMLIKHPTRPASKVVGKYIGTPGKGSAFKAIFEVAGALGVKACAVVDSDLRSITPEWVEVLIGPVLSKGFDFVAPYYSRHKYDGTITNMVVYPLTRALYGRRIRQPIGGDFGFSGRLAKNYLEKDIWGTEVARYGIDIWMTTTAITEGFRICQANLGAKIHEAKDPSKALGPMFRQVIATTFDLIEREHEYWRAVEGSRATAMFGFRPLVAIEPVSVDLESMIRGYKEGYEIYKEYWASFLSRDDLSAIEEIAMLDLDDYHFPADLWVKIMYDFAIGYHRKISGHPTEYDLFFNSLIPLYFGRTSSFVIESKDMPNGDAEKLVEDQCKKFEEMKDYLVERW